MLRIVVCFLISLTSYFPLAQADDGDVTISDLSWLEQQHLDQQVEKIDELARSNFGMQVHGTQQDLELLQRIINRGVIARDDHLTQQALGAVLGNLMVNDFGLEWKRYEDKQGRSRATCVGETDKCLFPITMLSRRMAVGLLPNVHNLYQETREMITPFLPKNPYDAALERAQEKVRLQEKLRALRTEALEQ